MIRARLIVILAAVVLVAGVTGLLWWRASPDERLVVTVTAADPGSAAPEVERTIAAPIEEQLRGVEHLLRLRSRSRHDGSYRLEVSFTRGIDVELAQVLVQNRVALALPILPVEVQRAGVTVRKGAFGPLMLISVVSPDGRFDGLQLSLFTNLKLKDELARLPGVSEVTVLGTQEYVLRVWPDAAKLKIRDLSASDVTRALEEQKFDVTGGVPDAPGGVLTATSAAQGGLITADQIDATVIKSKPEGHKIRLRDVCRVDLEVRRLSSASLDGKEAVVLAVYPLATAQASDVKAFLRAKLEDLRRQLPDGVDMSAGFDFSQEAMADRRNYLVIDVDPPAGVAPERFRKILARGEAALRQQAGVRNVLALSEQPFDRDRDQACLVAACGPPNGRTVDRSHLMHEIRTRFTTDVKDASIRIRELSSASGSRLGHPIAFSLTGPDRARLQELARQLAARLSQESRLTDVRAGLRLKPALAVNIDRAKAAARDVDLAEIFASLQAILGYEEFATASRSDGTWLFGLPADAGKRPIADTLNQLKVRNRQGQMVPLSAVVAAHRVDEPAQLERIDLQPAISITAAPAGGSTLAEARSVCEHVAAEVLPKDQPAQYRLVWTDGR